MERVKFYKTPVQYNADLINHHLRISQTDIFINKDIKPKKLIAKQIKKKRQSVVRFLRVNFPELSSKQIAQKIKHKQTTVEFDVREMKTRGLEISLRAGNPRSTKVIEEENKIKTLIEENPNISNKEISEKIGKTQGTVKDRLRSMRRRGEIVPLRKPKPSRSPKITERRQQIEQLLIEHPNFTHQKISEIIGCTKKDVENDIYRGNIQRKGKKH